jgi:hypothetical protein
VTSVDPLELIKPLRQMYNLYGYVTSNYEKVMVRVYEMYSTPVRPYLKMKSYFEWKHKLMPSEAYKLYEVFRKEIGEKAIERAKKALGDLKNTKQT